MRALDERGLAEALLGALGYSVETDEDYVLQVGSVITAPTAPHFLWHELGHALTYLGDRHPRRPNEDWFPLPAWVEAMNLPEQEADRVADLFANIAAGCLGLDGVPGSTPAGRRELVTLLSRVPVDVGRWFLLRLGAATGRAGLPIEVKSSEGEAHV